MRHLLSLIAGVVVAPLAWALVAMGQAGTAKTLATWTAANAFDTTDLIKPAAYLAAAGIVLGLIATLRISPLGPLVAGLAYLGLYVGFFIDPFKTSDAVPNGWKVFGDPIPLRTPLNSGVLCVIGALLVMSAVSAKRWRDWPVAAVPAVEGLGEAAPADETRPFGIPETEAPTEVVTPSAPAPSWPPMDLPAAGDTGGGLIPPRHAAGDEPTAGQSAGDSPWSAPPRPSGQE
ncbi:MAG TPA: hypothetical protein VFE14_14700 [Micromonosporaceae bacterium]|jgi:hypothetical protein|nr:hypothetical protein [Micromonosporaceae bacterium]